MLDHPFRLDAYLERIRYDGPLTISPKTLCGLHWAQVMSIPFENLDMFLGRRPQLDPTSLVRKLVDERRGGYCHELNGLFGLVLRHLGFSVTPLAARVFAGETPMQKSHQLMLVEINGARWLADTGFGSNELLSAIPLELEHAFPQHLETFRLQADPKLGFVLQHALGGRLAKPVRFFAGSVLSRRLSDDAFLHLNLTCFPVYAACRLYTSNRRCAPHPV